MDLPRMDGKTCLITGATSGIGAVAARELARLGAQVVVVGRDPARTQATVEQIKAATNNPKVEALLADLSALDQVRHLARQVLDRYPRLDVLINNAGGIQLKREVTVDGFEKTYAVNHLAYFLLTVLLLDRLKASAPARVVNVSSGAHRRVTLDFDDLQSARAYSGWRTYSRSKLANLLFTYELARRLEGTGVSANALHPGWVSTGFGGNNGWLGRAWQGFASLFALTPEQGARTIVYLAASPEVEGVSGKYFIKEKQALSKPASLDVEAASRLWQVSLEQTGLASAKPSNPSS